MTKIYGTGVMKMTYELSDMWLADHCALVGLRGLDWCMRHYGKKTKPGGVADESNYIRR